MERFINKIILHCSATPARMDIGAAEIKKWHTDPKPAGNGWRDIGYHFIIRRDGTIEDGRHIDIVGAHARGHNRHSIGICMVGGTGSDGKPESNFTKEQWATLYLKVRALVGEHPQATVHGHNEFSDKACPSFNVRTWWGA